jgi:hypothetical protein
LKRLQRKILNRFKSVLRPQLKLRERFRTNFGGEESGKKEEKKKIIKEKKNIINFSNFYFSSLFSF